MSPPGSKFRNPSLTISNMAKRSVDRNSKLSNPSFTISNIAKRSDDPNSNRGRKRKSGLDAVGGGASGGSRRSARLAHHYGAGTAQGTSNTACEVMKCRRQRRKITAQGGTPETQDHLKREITTDGNSYMLDKIEYRLQRGIRVVGCDDVPNPIRTFNDTRFPENVIQEFSKAGFVRPTPIQAQVWSIDLKDHDLIGIAKPGSGKKLAYLMHAIVHVNSRPKRTRVGDGPIVLILVPTTQHGEQIQQDYAIFAAASNIEVLFGWDLLEEENSGWTSGGGILIDTPRSLLSLLKWGCTNLKSVTYLVLDGADWMLSNADEPQIQSIVSQIRSDCQISFWGTSWPDEVDKRASLFLQNACKVQIVPPVLKATPPIDQIVYVVTEDQKYDKLVELLGVIVDRSRILISMDIKKGCESRDHIAQQLCTDGHHTVSFREDKSQAERVRIVSEFQAGKIPIMIATDVAACDLDLKDVKYVINYDFPGSLDDYVYHIDRFGSAASKGTAYTFFTTANAGCAKELAILLKKAGQNVSSELEQLGRDVTYSGTYIPPSQRWVANNKKPGSGHFYPMYPHCPDTKSRARYAVEEVRKEKGHQLHFVRVVEAYERLSCIIVSMSYLTLEAAHATTYKKNLYQAIVVRMPDKEETVLFGIVNSDGRLSKIHDTRKGLEYEVYKIWPEADESNEDGECWGTGLIDRRRKEPDGYCMLGQP